MQASGYPNMEKSRPYRVSILNEKYNYFLRYWGFVQAEKSPKVKGQNVRGQVSSLFLEATNWGLTIDARISVLPQFNLALFQLYGRFFVLRQILTYWNSVNVELNVPKFEAAIGSDRKIHHKGGMQLLTQKKTF